MRVYLSPLSAEKILVHEVPRRRWDSNLLGEYHCIIAGVRMNGESGSMETGMRGRAFIIAVTSAIRVHKTL